MARSVVMKTSVKLVIKLYSHEFNSPLVGRLRITETLGFVFYSRPARRHIMDHFLYRRCRRMSALLVLPIFMDLSTLSILQLPAV